jgi:signal transduction histidine kinase
MLLGAANIKYEQLQSIYEVDEKNHQISELQKQNEINDLKIKQHRTTRLFLAIAIVLALLIASIIAIFYRRIQQKNKLLAEANATKDRFFAIIAHDLRGPCLTLTTFLEQVLNEYDDIDKEELKEMLVASHQSSEKVSKLLDTLLTWANSQRNKIDIKPEHLDFDRALAQALEGLKHSAEKKQISINTPDNTGLSVFADANMLQTILRNLLNNAIKFTPRNGAIQVSYKAIKSNHLVIRIADNGVGIPSHLIQNLFKLSNQYHTRGTENESSSGLGLILVKEFVDKNKGQISITSKVNKGTIVNIKLPLGKSTV